MVVPLDLPVLTRHDNMRSTRYTRYQEKRNALLAMFEVIR